MKDFFNGPGIVCCSSKKDKKMKEGNKRCLLLIY